MAKIEVIDKLTGGVPEKISSMVASGLAKVLDDQCDGTEIAVSVVFVEDDEIRELNRRFRNIDAVTDVLSFQLGADSDPESQVEEEQYLGEIIIALDRARCQASEYGHSVEEEVMFLAVHGLLHLLGYDHESEPDEREMRRKEVEILGALGWETNS